MMNSRKIKQIAKKIANETTIEGATVRLRNELNVNFYSDVFDVLRAAEFLISTTFIHAYSSAENRRLPGARFSFL